MEEATNAILQTSDSNTKKIMDHSTDQHNETRQVIQDSATTTVAQFMLMEGRINSRLSQFEETVRSAQKSSSSLPPPSPCVSFATSSVTPSVTTDFSGSESSYCKKLEEEKLQAELENGLLKSKLNLYEGRSKDPYATPVRGRKRNATLDARNEASNKKHFAVMEQGRAQRAKERANKL